MRPRDYAPHQLAIIKRTIAADCNEQEFNLLIEVARRAGADLFRRHLHAVVYNKDDPEKRKMAIITGIDFFRATAARNRDYRPDENEPAFEIDEARKGTSNPEGLVKATVRAYKFGPDRQWHPLVGVAYWNEFAPMKMDGEFEWKETGEFYPPGHKKAGKPKYQKVPKGDTVKVPDGKWASMPHVMLAKCAEVQALRKGWPEDLSGIYTAEEMEGAMLDVTASAEVELHEKERRLALVHAKDTVPILWEVGQPIEAVPVGKLADKVAEFIGRADSVTGIEAWERTNVAGLREFWALHKGDALELKKVIEGRKAALAKE
jgi:phage recombination protein Bet